MMANGTPDEKVARADRIAEQSAKAQRAAEQSRKATQNSIANLRRAGEITPGSEPYRAEMDSVSEVTIGKEGVKLKSRAPWLQFAISLLVFLAFVAWLFAKR